MPLLYRHAFLTQTALRSIQAEIRTTRWVETGGALAGYVSADNALVLTHASGPGPRAIKRPWSITIDAAYTTAFCNKIYEESKRRLDYIGDWHAHLGCSTSHSEADVEAMRIIADAGVSAVPYPASLIYALWQDALAIYVYAEGQLLPLQASIIPTIPI